MRRSVLIAELAKFSLFQFNQSLSETFFENIIIIIIFHIELQILLNELKSKLSVISQLLRKTSVPLAHVLNLITQWL